MTRNPSSSPQGRASSTVKKTGSTGTPTPCCSKVGLKRGPWTPEEDEVLADYIRKEGEGRWRTLPKRAGLLRCGKSCRLRWMNYLRPSVKRGQIAADEEDLILRLHRLLGNRWSLIAGRIPGRTDNEIKNYWNTHLSKKLISQGIDPRTHKPLIPPILPSPSTTTTTTTTPHNNNNHSSKDYLPIITNTSNHHNIILDQPNTPIPIPNNNNLIINGNQEGFDPKSTSTHMGEELDQFQPHAHHHIKGANNHNSAYDNLDIASNDVSATGLIKSNIDNLLITSNNEDTHHYDDVNYCSDDIFSSFLNSLINEDAFASHHVQLEPPNNGNNHNNNIALLPCDDHHDYDNDPLISITTSSALDVAWDQSSPLVPATFSQKEDPNSKMVEDDHHNK